jgi:hypothetical protein
MTADAIDVAPGAPLDEVQNLPDAVLTYLLPSRYCESEQFFDMVIAAPRSTRRGNQLVRLDAGFPDQLGPHWNSRRPCAVAWLCGNAAGTVLTMGCTCPPGG